MHHIKSLKEGSEAGAALDLFKDVDMGFFPQCSLGYRGTGQNSTLMYSFPTELIQ